MPQVRVADGSVPTANQTQVNTASPTYVPSELQGMATEPTREFVSAENERSLEELKRVPEGFRDRGEKVAVLFADLIGSTGFKYNRAEIDGIAKAYDHNQIVDTTVEHPDFGGMTVKFVGDEVMAFFAGDGCAERAIRAALRVISRFDEYNAKVFDWPYRIDTRIGIHFGPVWMFKFKQLTRVDPMGPTVDMAKRLCDIAPPMHVAFTGETRQQAGIELCAGARGPQSRPLKGIPELQDLYTLSSGRETEEIPLRGARRAGTPAIDRDLERAESLWLASQLDDARVVYERVLQSEQRNFVALFRLAELYGIYDINGGSALPERLLRALNYLAAAQAECPDNWRVWALTSCVLYRQFVRHRTVAYGQRELGLDPDVIDTLAKAIVHADHALKVAEAMLDLVGAANAKSQLIILWAEDELIRGSLNVATRQRITRYREELQHVDGRGVGNRYHANHKVAEAMVQYGADRRADPRFRKGLADALSLDPDNIFARAGLQSTTM